MAVMEKKSQKHKLAKQSGIIEKYTENLKQRNKQKQKNYQK